MLKKWGFLAVLLIVWANLNAQPTTGDPNQGAKPGAAPISGIGLLMAVGGLLGAKRIFDARKKK